MAAYEHIWKDLPIHEPPNLRPMENCGKCLQSGKFSNFQDAWCKKFKKKVKITEVCDKYE